MIKIDDFVKQWFGEQTTDAELRAKCLCELYEICEYQEAVAGLVALKKSCWAMYQVLYGYVRGRG